MSVGLFIGGLLTVAVWQSIKEASNKNRSNQSEALSNSWPVANVRASMGITNLETTEARIAPKNLVVVEGRSHPETMVEDQREADAWPAEATKRVSKAG